MPTFYYQHKKQASGRLIRIIDCTDVHISDVIMKNSESRTLLILGCDDVNIRGVRIFNPLIFNNVRETVVKGIIPPMGTKMRKQSFRTPVFALR